MVSKVKNLLPNLQFPTACYDIQCRNQFLLCTGTYSLEFKFMDMQTHSCKYERYCVEEVRRCEFITDDKFCLLRIDKAVEFHTNAGLYETVKLPHNCYDIKCNIKDLFIAEKELKVLDLVKGELYSTLAIQGYELHYNALHRLLGINTSCGISFVDNRTNDIVYTYSDNATAFDMAGNMLLYANKTTVNEVDLRNYEKITNIMCQCTKVIYRNEDYKIFGNNKNIYFNNKNIKIDINYDLNVLCSSREYLFIGGETEIIDIYAYD